MALRTLSLALPALRAAYNDGLKVRDLLAEVRRRIETGGANPIWISLLDEGQLEPFVRALENASPRSLPLYGVPFAIKDNIDLAGMATTAACPALAYQPSGSAVVVQRLIDAGAIPVGKTNLDQLATGLVGTRSPYGAVCNAFDPAMISGGSSAGSAVAVALGQVSFSLGTDTAGSGRVPAAFNNLVGYKPSRGLLSTTGVVPACRTLDCVSIFSLTVADAMTVSALVDDPDPSDAFGRRDREPDRRETRVLGLPHPEQLEFFGNDGYRESFDNACRLLAAMYPTCRVDITPLLSAARLLYEGPWVAERYLAARTLIENHPGDLRQEFLAVVSAAADMTALQSFEAIYRLAAYRREAATLFDSIDALVLPTVGTHYSLREVEAAPLQRNTDNGFYTNFVNLLDLCAVAVPAGFTSRGLPFGISLVAEAMRDESLLLAAAGFLRQQGPRQLGATGDIMTEPVPPAVTAATLPVAVCGAHLDGMPLNSQLTDRDAVLREATTTSPGYRLYALPGGPPFRPGLVRESADGVAIEVEVWNLPLDQVGSFLAGIPAPLGLGKVELASGEWVTGFICEPCGLAGAEDISGFGGWRGYMASKALKPA